MDVIRSLKKATKATLHISAVKKVLIGIPGVCKLYHGWDRVHPFDRENNVETSGFVPVDKIHSDPKMQSLVNPYGAVQPSVVRSSLRLLGDVGDYTFVDLGCGKGRATMVATEFPLKAIVGVELSASLAEMGRKNAAILAARFPDRKKVTIYSENALDYELPEGKIIIYLYHSFGRTLVRQLMERLEASVASGHNTHIFFIYANPVFWSEADGAPSFSRFLARTLDYHPSEVGFGPDKTDTIVVWQSKQGAVPSPYEDRDAQVIEHHPNWKAGLVSVAKAQAAP